MASDAKSLAAMYAERAAAIRGKTCRCGHPGEWHTMPNAGNDEGCTARDCACAAFHEPESGGE